MKVDIEPNPALTARFDSLLRANLAGCCLLKEVQIERLRLHFETLRAWNRVLNLTSLRKVDEAVTRHYCESLFLATHLPLRPLSIADVGSGAGFPGFPVAVFRPDCQVTLIESHKRKAVFLREVSREIPNITVLPVRAENVNAKFDWLVSRAVSPGDVLRLVSRLAPSVALLTGLADSSRLMASSALHWRPPIPLPWGKRRVLMIGECC